MASVARQRVEKAFTETAFAETERRIVEIQEWLRETDPDCFTQQLHLDKHSSECVYWHYGYLVALKDTLALMGRYRNFH